MQQIYQTTSSNHLNWMSLLYSTNLHYMDSKSDKVYQIELCKVPRTNLWNINFAYGKRGNTLVMGTKNESPVSFSCALRMYNDLVSSKLKKGYKPTGVEWLSNNKFKVYESFAAALLDEKNITEKEYSSVTRMLSSKDPEAVNIAEILIETKEKAKWDVV
jgi:hypothetical protein